MGAMTADPSPEAVRWLHGDEQQAWRSFVTGTRRLLDHLERDLKAHGLTHDDYGLLVVLSEAEGGRLRMADLAARSVESRSRLSHHVARLEGKGLVTRESCAEDGRGLFAVLTDRGRQVMEETAPHHVAGVRAYFLDHLRPEELAAIGTAFARIEGACTAACASAGEAPDDAACDRAPDRSDA